MSVVQPSADIKAIIEKTAAFVAKRGDAMEKRILSQDQSSSKLSFLRPQDPLNPYYRQLVLKLRESSAQTASTETGTSASATATQTTNSTSDITKTTTNQKSDQDPGKSTKSVPAQTQQIQPPAKNKFTITPPHLTPFEM